jgi:hypothetical protein
MYNQITKNVKCETFLFRNKVKHNNCVCYRKQSRNKNIMKMWCWNLSTALWKFAIYVGDTSLSTVKLFFIKLASAGEYYYTTYTPFPGSRRHLAKWANTIVKTRECLVIPYREICKWGKHNSENNTFEMPSRTRKRRIGTRNRGGVHILASLFSYAEWLKTYLV